MNGPQRWQRSSLCLVAGTLLGIGAMSGWLDTGPAVKGQNRNNVGETPPVNAFSAALALEQTFVKVIERAEKSVVSIARIRRSKVVRPPRDFLNPNRRNPDDPASPDFVPNDFGSGVIIAPPGNPRARVILTNYHVVQGGPVDKQPAQKTDIQLYVRLWNRRGFYATLIAADPRADLAVLRIDFAALNMQPADIPALPFTQQKTFRKGQLVLALGNPYAQARDGSASASWGMISNISRRPKPLKNADSFQSRRQETLHHLGTLLQVDTRLSIGTSGGALLNLKGELIGLTTSLAALEGYETSVGYAVPFNAAFRKIIGALSRGYEVDYGYLGVTPQDVSPERLGGLPRRLKRQYATMVIEAHPNSPARRGGLQAGDIILAVDEQPVYNRYDLMRSIGLAGAGHRSRLRIWRAGNQRELDLVVQLGKWPVLNEDGIIATAERFPTWRGIRVDYPTARYRFLQRPYRYLRAVVVLEVHNAALKKNGALQPGDFITHVEDVSVQTPAEFHAAVRGRKGTVTLRLADGSRLRIAP